MKKIAFIYGGIAGAIIISVMTLGLVVSDGEGASSSEAFGYLTMLIVLSMIFVGVKKYRDQDLGGVIKFGPAFGLGVAIASVAGLFYVMGWEFYLAATDHAFIDDYTAGVIESKRAAGMAGADLNKLIADMEAMKKTYANPLFRMPMTFLEIFPVGLVVALFSAALLRNPKILPSRGPTTLERPQ